MDMDMDMDKQIPPRHTHTRARTCAHPPPPADSTEQQAVAVKVCRVQGWGCGGEEQRHAVQLQVPGGKTKTGQGHIVMSHMSHLWQLLQRPKCRRHWHALAHAQPLVAGESLWQAANDCLIVLGQTAK